ncbi:potassium uptake TrkH family protein [Oikeobacillus pervagus]|uniref:Potassium uptake TrkH family protein n=1 Tax=Oikeobacillus pervagus TaxID=1325931 RepID=A0AAJ1T2R6_9BACI|nr:TrkH family potassium uptake protein [Oikeobacillus pervagus]MDQ0214854.1 potassium uptake TrkH family protein [Oikeobacillus pervagus]
MQKNIRKHMKKLVPAQVFVSYYLIAITVSTLLLSLPVALKPGVEWTFIDALFTAVSAVSVTGLSTISIVDTFSTTGIFLLMFVLQFGGVGIMTLGTVFWMIMGKKIGLKERRLIMLDQNQTSLSGLVQLLLKIFRIVITIELIGAVVLGIYYLNYYPVWYEAFLHGLFSSVSATTNAGFDITGNSLIDFADDYFVQFITMLLIIAGAIGFPVLVETKEYIFHRNDHQKFYFSLYTKITTLFFGILLVVGAILIFLIENQLFFLDKTWHEALFYSLFQSVTVRSAGLATVDPNVFSTPTLLVMSVLMFIGASPSSVGGGIRTTTFALNMLFVMNFARGRRDIKIFKREIHEIDIMRSIAVTIMAVSIFLTATLILLVTEDHELIEIIFEVASAFGTCGLSLGITDELTVVGKLVLIVLMFIGRVGILSFLFMIGGREKVSKYHYPKERVSIG